MRLPRFLAALPAFLLIAPATASEAERAPTIGGEGPEADACGGIGRVAAFTARSGGVLEVHEHPSEAARTKHRLEPDTLVWLCEAAEEWQGIVFATGEFQDLGDCRVSRPVATPEPYSGPCESGWVLAERLQLVTG